MEENVKKRAGRKSKSEVSFYTSLDDKKPCGYGRHLVPQSAHEQCVEFAGVLCTEAVKNYKKLYEAYCVCDGDLMPRINVTAPIQLNFDDVEYLDEEQKSCTKFRRINAELNSLSLFIESDTFFILSNCEGKNVLKMIHEEVEQQLNKKHKKIQHSLLVSVG